MKTKVIGIIGLALLGVAAGGCSAEQGSGSEGPSVGENRAPLALADLPTTRRGAASCVIRDTDSIDKMLVFGGVNGTSMLNTAYLYSPADDSWTLKDNTYGGGAGTAMPTLVNAKMVAIPGEDKCLLTGGTTTDIGEDSNPTTASAETYEYDLSANNWTKVGDLNGGNRRFFSLSICGTDTGVDMGSPAHIIAVGGEGWDGLATTFRNSIDVYNANAGTWANLTTLGTARSKFAMSVVPDDTFDQFMIEGGRSAVGTELRTVELLQVTSACALTSRVNGDDTTTAALRQDGVLFPEGTANTFQVTAGSNNGSPIANTDKVLVVNWGTGDITVTASVNSITTARDRATLVQYSPTKWAVVGGITSAPAVDNAVQIWDTVTKSWRGETDLITARFGFAAEYLPTEERAIVVGGATATNGLTYTDKVESL